MKSVVVTLLVCLGLFSCKRSRAYEVMSEVNESRTEDYQKSEVDEVQIDKKQDLDISQSSYVVGDSIIMVDSHGKISEQLLNRNAYVLSYNKSTRNPNWVAWHLTREHTDGPYPRKGVPYYADDGTVYGIGKVTPETCRNSYFVDLECEEPRQQLDDWTGDYNMSHGHMCPAGDNKWDKAAINQSFLLTNMCPQDRSLNSGGWNKLEEKCRAWANQYGGIYIVAGPVFKEPITRTLGKGKIAVPDSFFKVVLCLEGTPKAIGFIYKNDSSSQSMKSCACTVDDVEKRTGFDFFASLPDETEDSIEAIFELNEWDVR